MQWKCRWCLTTFVRPVALGRVRRGCLRMVGQGRGRALSRAGPPGPGAPSPGPPASAGPPADSESESASAGLSRSGACGARGRLLAGASDARSVLRDPSAESVSQWLTGSLRQSCGSNPGLVSDASGAAAWPRSSHWQSGPDDADNGIMATPESYLFSPKRALSFASESSAPTEL